MNYMQCTIDECHIVINRPRLYGGKPYCETHYWEVQYGEFNEEFSKWRVGDDPPDRFKYLLGSIPNRHGWLIEGNSYLSAARIRDRGFNFEKTESGCRFEITRHPGAFGKGFVDKKEVQAWEADIVAKTLTILSTRDYKTGEYDP